MSSINPLCLPPMSMNWLWRARFRGRWQFQKRLRRFRQRHRKVKCCSFACQAFETDLSSVRFDNSLGDRQPEAHSKTGRLSGLDKSIEKMRKNRPINARTAVADKIP